KVTVADAVAILQHIANKDKFELKPQGKINADVDGVDGITASDALTIQKKDAGIIDKLPHYAG
ncbi:MAG: glycoside hydrolase, partial [Ruminococcus sp.]|nr:glycoside hydrolase [Ruminococcus sp.]